MRYSEFAERFGDLEQEEFLTRFDHPFLLENVELQDDTHDRRVFLVRGSKGNALLIGRGPRCHIPVRDVLVSTKHAELLPPEVAGAGEWHIVDLGSTNKTFLSGRELEPDFPAPVTDRAALALGPSAHFTFLHPLSFFQLLQEQLSHTPEPRETAATTDLLGTIPYGQLTSAPKAAREVVDPTRASGDELLVFCEPLDPIPLDVGLALVVGRSAQTADLVLNHKHVSRRHTEIQRLPHGVFARDMGSSNGTLLDGEKLPDDWVPLPIGAVLVIGPYRIYVAGPQSSGTAMNLGGTLVMGRKRGTEGIEGSLTDMSLEMVLQEIETEQHTGALELSGATITGRLSFLNGHPRDASTDDGLAGGDAVLRLLKETRGTYLLRPTTEIGEAQIDRTFSELLLERFLSEA